MHQNRLFRVMRNGSVVAMTLLALGLAACGSGGASQNKELILGTELPTSGADGAQGLPTQNGAELAVLQAKLPNGYTIKLLSKDDVSTSKGSHDPATGANNITDLAKNAQVIGVVGPFNSGVAAAEIPIAQASTLTLISPSNTNPGLTIEAYAQDNGFVWAQLHPSGKPNSYFRLPGNDIVQGAILADIASAPASVNGPGYKTVFVVDDSEVYGKGLADQFLKQFTTKDGGSQVGKRESLVDAKDPAINTVALEIIAAHPDFVFYGGVSSLGGPQLKAAVAAAGGATIPWLGGDGIAQDPDWLAAAGPAAVNTFGTVAAPGIDQLDSAKQFISDYKAKYGSDPLNYSGVAYDAANIIIQAATNVINAGKTPTRQNVRDEVAKITYNGVTGKISFDANGDNAGAKVFSVYVVGTDLKWTFVQNVTASS